MDRNHLNISEEDQPRIIPVKFGQNPISGLGDVVKDFGGTDGRRRRRWTVSDHKSYRTVF